MKSYESCKWQSLKLSSILLFSFLFMKPTRGGGEDVLLIKFEYYIIS